MYFAVAALIFWRKSDDLMALLASFCLVALGGSFPDIPATLAALHPAWHVPVTLISEGVIGFPSLILFFFLFPDGRFVPRWTRWIVIASALLYISGSLFPNSFLNPSNWPGPFFPLVPFAMFGSLVATQIYRYRRISTLMQRQQTKWIVFGLSVALLGFLLLGVVLPDLVRLNMPLQNLNILSSTILITSIYLHPLADSPLSRYLHPALSTMGCGCPHKQDAGLRHADDFAGSGLLRPHFCFAIPVPRAVPPE